MAQKRRLRLVVVLIPVLNIVVDDVDHDVSRTVHALGTFPSDDSTFVQLLLFVHVTLEYQHFLSSRGLEYTSNNYLLFYWKIK